MAVAPECRRVPCAAGASCAEPLPPASQALMEGIEAGDLTWHAMPHNGQTELYDAPLLEWAARFTHALDRRFKKREKMTMSQVHARRLGGCKAASEQGLARASTARALGSECGHEEVVSGCSPPRPASSPSPSPPSILFGSLPMRCRGTCLG